MHSHLLRSLLALSLVSFASAACSSASDAPAPGRGSAPVGTVRSPIIKGKSSDASQDAVVLLMHYDPVARSFGSCTGTLLAPNLVLTARHCVADTDVAAACDVDGTPLAEGEIRKNRKPATMHVFTGPQRPDFRDRAEPAGTGEQILDDGGKNLCNHDIALIVLKEPVPNAVIAPIRLDSDPVVGESLTAVGWGVTDKTDSPDVRQQRTGISVASVGPDPGDDRLPVPPNEFSVGESICSGDSGGPAIATETGAIVGVVSRGGNGERTNQADPSATCVGTDAHNLYTKVSSFKDFILQGFEAAGAEPWLEGGEDPRLAKAGVACSDGAECRSSLCLADPDQSGATTCAQSCASTACPEGHVCKVEGEAQVCRLAAAPSNGAKTTTTTCSASPGAASSSGGGSASAALVLLALGLVAGRARSRR